MFLAPLIDENLARERLGVGTYGTAIAVVDVTKRDEPLALKFENKVNAKSRANMSAEVGVLTAVRERLLLASSAPLPPPIVRLETAFIFQKHSMMVMPRYGKSLYALLVRDEYMLCCLL